MQKTLLAILAATLALASLPAVLAAPTLAITSTPAVGSYTMTVSVGSFALEPVSMTPSNQAGHGHIHYFLNGAPAAGSYATPQTSFAFSGLKVGDVVTAELVNNDHSSLSPPIIQTQVVGAGLTITSAPVVGEYTMAVLVPAFQLVPVQASPVNAAGKGHIHYFVNGAPAAGSYATPDKTFAFAGVKQGDIVTAELVNNDHSSLNSPQIATQAVGQAVVLTSGTAKTGDYTMTVTVPGLKLSDVNLVNPVDVAGQGHVHYLLNGKPCADACAGGAVYASKALSFTFRGLVDGDVVAAQLVNNDHSNIGGSGALVQSTVGKSGYGTPGLELPALLAALGAVAFLARRR